jgi:nuclear pore complex protein Nup188
VCLHHIRNREPTQNSSWETAFDALSNLDLARQASSLQSFLREPQCITLLSRPFSPHTQSSPQSKADFDQRTAEIPAVSNGQNDVGQLKEDVKWLTQEAKIDEVAALRLCILEWQSRPAARILQGYTAEERISLQNATNATELGASVAGKRSNVETTGSNSIFDTQSRRRTRLSTLLVSEREHLLGVTALITASAMAAPAEPEGRSYGSGKKRDASEVTWLPAVALQMEEARTAEKQNGAEQSVVAQGLTAVEMRLRGLESGSGHAVDEDEVTAFEQNVRRNQLAEIVRLLQLLFIRISSHKEPLPAADVKAWYEFADRYGFFERLQLVSFQLT